MDLQKLHRRKQKAEDENNQQALAEACNKLGNFYASENRYQDALREFRQEASISQLLGKRMDYGRANRMLGEVYMLLGNYKEALKFQEVYLKAANLENDMVEMQRAYASVGRCHLMQAEVESVEESSDAAGSFKEAEKAFIKSLMVCNEIGKDVSKYEAADMQARLYLNLGVTKEHIEEFDEAINYYETAIKICKSNDIFELHFQCLMAAGLVHSTRKNDTSTASNLFNSALEVAKRLPDKNEKLCETLLAKSGLIVMNGDFQSAKQVLKKAFRLKTPCKADSEAIQKNLKTILALCKCEDQLVTTDSYDYAKRKELFEKLGDGSCKLRNFSKAIDFYLKMLEAAQLNGESEHQLIPIYVSLYQTYIDVKEFESAQQFMQKEFELIKNEPKEACATLLGLAKLLDLAGKDFWEVDTMYRKALAEARKTNDPTMEKNVTQKLVKLCRKRFMVASAEILEQEATDRGIALTDATDDTEYSEDIPDISNDISIELELSSDGESSDSDQNRPPKPNGSSARRRRPAITVKKNAKGETRLHEACINGNYQLVKMLIDQGHALNPRDNAGWLPLHEAAIHGHRDIVELLLDSGASSSINDKGGTSCDGITPLYDAASNGNLSVVQLLLDRGAKATVKTDFNETPLDALLRWFDEYGKKLSPSEKGFYEDIKQRLVEHCEKVGIDTTAKASNTGSSGYNSSKSRNSQTVQNHRQNLRFDLSESEEEPTREDENKVNCREYKNIMKRLKNSNKDQRYAADDKPETKRPSAHLTVNDFGPDNWLEDDLGPTRKKQRFHDGFPVGASSPLDRSPVKVVTFPRNPSSVLLDSDSDAAGNASDDVLNAFNRVMNAGDGAKKKKAKRRKEARRPTSQPSLLDAGFSRFVEVEESSRKSPAKVPSPAKFPSPHNSSFNENLNRSNPIEKQLIIKVQIGDEKVIVPVNKDAAHELKISWLGEEAARRYYCIKGIRPELKLKTSDGATLLPSDPVALILSLTDENLIHSEILDWKLPSLAKRYLEACSELKCAVDPDMNELLQINQLATHLDLSNQNLRPSHVRPVLKALQHQSCLVQLDLSKNFIQDEGIKFLAQALVTLKQLQLLDVSGNSVTEKGVESLCNALAKCENPSEIAQLKLSFNPIKSSSLRSISGLCQTKKISSLFLTSCELTDANGLEQLGTLKSLDISFNHLTSDGLKTFLRKINSGIVESLNLERCSSDEGVGDSIVQFITSGCFESLQQINIAGLNLDENEILDIVRSLEKCEQLKSMDLSHQKQLTFLSLKYLLFSMESRSLERVRLVGCKNIQQTVNMFGLQNLGARQRQANLRNVQLSIPTLDASERRTFCEKMKELWDVVTGFRGRVDQKRNILHLSLDDDATEVHA